MIDFETATSLIFKAIDDLNRQRPIDDHLTKAHDTILAGEGGILDSLALITLLVSIEDQTESICINRVSLLEEVFMEGDTEQVITVAGIVSRLTNGKK